MKKGDVVEIKNGILAGVQAVILRQSRRTGGLTLELLEDKGAYKRGNTVNMAPYDVRISMVTR